MSSSPAAPDPWGERLPRRLGLGSAIGLLIANSIGSGIFRVPATVAGTLEHAGPILLAWAVGGALTLCAALSLAEPVAAIPRSGGLFRILHTAYGPVPAFMLGVAEVLVIAPAGLAAVATIFAAYLGHFVPLGDDGVRYVAAGGMLSVGVANYLGVRGASAVFNLSTLAKYGGLLLLAALAFAGGPPEGAIRTDPWLAGPSAAVFAAALVPIMFTYEGWADLSRVAGEVRNPARSLPLAMGLGVTLVVIIYLTTNVVYLYLLPVERMAASPLVAATAAAQIPALGAWAANGVAALVMVSCYGNMCGGIMVYPRTQFAMAEQGMSIGPLARVSPRFQTPSVAIWTITVLSALSCLSSSFQHLAGRFVLGLWPFYCLGVAAVFVLRKSHPDLPRPYRVWGYPVVPALCLLAAVGMLVGALVIDPVNTGITFALLAAGVPIYYLTAGRRPQQQRVGPSA